MTRLTGCVLTGIAILLSFVAPSIAADPPEKSAAYAVIVGVGEFTDKQILPRPSAVDDAQALYDVLVNSKVGDIPADHIQLLLSGTDEKRKSKVATKANILEALKDVAAKAHKGDRVIIAIVDQGATSGERTCIFGTDSTFKDRAKDSVLSADVEAAFKGVKSENLCVLLDLNLKGFTANKDDKVLAPNVMDVVRAFMGIKDKDEEELPQGRVVILAGRSRSQPVTTDHHDIFMRATVDGLKGAADKDGGEPDGNVTVDELSKYLRDEVPNLARKYGQTDEEKEQLPISFARNSHFVLTHNPEVYPKVVKQLEKLESLAKDEKIDKDIAEEGSALLGRMPRVKERQALRKDYQKLVDGGFTVEEFMAAKKLQEATKLDTYAAKSYSEKLMRALDVFDSEYYKEPDNPTYYKGLNLTDMVVNAIKGLYHQSDMQIPDPLKEKLDKAKNLDKDQLKALLTEARLPLGKREDLSSDQDVEISVREGIAKFVDPYTTYIDKNQIEEMQRQTDNAFTGIGVQIRRDLIKDGLLVISPIKGSPAYKAVGRDPNGSEHAGGLKAGDLITRIIRTVSSDGTKLEKPEDISTKGLDVSDAVKLILGKAGTKVTVEVQREGIKEPLKFDITRGQVMVETVLGYHRKMDDSWDYYIDPKSKIAYIHLTQFGRSSYLDMRKAIVQLDADGVKGLIIDVRFNPGGYLDVVKDICDLFIEDGLIVTIKGRDDKSVPLSGNVEPSYLNFPMVCMVNGESASASEILSACLQDHHRAVIMGERSYGKGTVQSIKPFKLTGGEIKLTTATFWRPSGKNLNKGSTKGRDEDTWGVTPDKGYLLKLSREDTDLLGDRLRDWGNIPNREAPVKEPTKEVKDFKDKQLDMAIDYLKSQIRLSGSLPQKKDIE